MGRRWGQTRCQHGRGCVWATLEWGFYVGCSAALWVQGFKLHTRPGTRAGSHYQRPSSGSREAISLECLRHTGRRSVWHAWVQGLVTYSTK